MNSLIPLLKCVFSFILFICTYILTLKERIGIEKVHQLRISKEGIVTKQFNEAEFSVWRGRSPTTGSGIEPFQLLKDFPDIDPQLIRVNPLPEKRIQTLSSTFGKKELLQDVLNEFLNLPVTPFVSLVDPIILVEPVVQVLPVEDIIVDKVAVNIVPEGMSYNLVI